MRRALQGAVVVLAVLVLVMGVLAVRRALDDGGSSAPAAASIDDAPVAAAEAAAKNFFMLDYRTLDADVARVLETATGEFEAQYRKQSATLQQEVVDKKLVLTATVPESGSAVEHVAGDEAWVLVSVDVLTEAEGTTPAPSRYRTRVVLQRDGGDWLIERLEQVG